MQPICDVKRELHYRAPRPHMAPYANRYYLGPGLRLVERVSFEVSDEVHEGMRQRFSEDNGRTWSEWETLAQAWPA